MLERARVLEVAPRYLPDLGGVETHVAEVSARLAGDPRVEITVLATDRHKEYRAFDNRGPVPVLRCRAWPAERDYYFAPGLRPLIANGGWDVVHVQGIHTLVPVIAMAAARRAGIPYIVTFHSGGSSSGLRRRIRGLQWRLLAPLLRGAAQLIAVSRFEQRHFARAIGIPVERITVIPNGGGLPDPDPRAVRVAGRIVSCGRLERYKGHHRVIAALPRIRAAVPDAHVVILGAGPYEADLRALAERLGVADAVSIRLIPPADRMAMADALASGAVLAALSQYEAHPVAVMEALAMGLPVVGVDAAGIGDLVDDGFVTGVSPDASDAEIATTVVAALEGPARSRVALPTWQEASDQLADHYVRVAGGDSALTPVGG